MAFYKLEHIFAQPPYGWTETWYYQGNTGLKGALAAAVKVARIRSKLLSGAALLQEVQASEEPDPAAGTVDNPGNPRATRGDSRVDNPAALPGVLGPGTVGNDPWEGILIPLVGAQNGDENGPFYRRSFILRGLPEGAYTGGTGVGVVFAPAFRDGMNQFHDALVNNDICIRAATKGLPSAGITVVAAGPHENTINLKSTLVGVSPGCTIQVTGFTRGKPGYNGRHRVVAYDGVASNTTIATTEGVIAPTPKAAMQLVTMGYFPIIASELEFRLTKRDTGRDRWISSAQKRREKASI